MSSSTGWCIRASSFLLFLLLIPSPNSYLLLLFLCQKYNVLTSNQTRDDKEITPRCHPWGRPRRPSLRRHSHRYCVFRAQARAEEARVDARGAVV
jgi:hypothetical protein